MTQSAPIAVRHLAIPVESGQFHLGAADGDPDAMERGLDDAVASGRFVGATDCLMTVVTPTEDSAGTPLTVEVWPVEPSAEIGWDHEVDIDFTVPATGLTVLTTAGADDVLPEVPAGSYRARVSGRGFTLLGAGDDSSSEEYRIRLWPRAAARSPQVRQSWPGWADY